jgi:NADH dehydrogenase
MIKPNIPESPLPRLVVIGAGFAGINLVKALRKSPFQIVLINRTNYHLFQPLLYQVATAGLEASSIAFPVRGIFKRKKNFIFRLAEVQQIHPEKSNIETTIGEIHYDYLVIATGSTSNYFGNQNIEHFSLGMKSLYEAIGLRNYGLMGLEHALLLSDIEKKKELLNVVIVGGGPTGVELAGALAEYKKTIFPKDYPELSSGLMTIHLIEALPSLLSNMSREASGHTYQYLTKLGVKIRLNTSVNSYDGENVFLSDGTTIATKYFVWSAGVMGNAPQGLNADVIERNGRIKVNEFNQLEPHLNIFAIGDVSQMINDSRFPKGYPMLAQVGIQQGKNLAANLMRLQNNKEMTPFTYRNKGTLATIGRNKAVADIGKMHITGFFAWVIWLTIHLMFLMGFRNKLVVFINWIYNYFTYDRGTRILLKRH